MVVSAVIASVQRISFFKGDISSKSKFHITLGHETVMGRITLFTSNTGDKQLNFNSEYQYLESLDPGKNSSLIG